MTKPIHACGDGGTLGVAHRLPSERARGARERKGFLQGPLGKGRRVWCGLTSTHFRAVRTVVEGAAAPHCGRVTAPSSRNGLASSDAPRERGLGPS